MKIIAYNDFDLDKFRDANPHLIVRETPGSIAVFPKSKKYGDRRPHGNVGKCKMCAHPGPGCAHTSPGVGYACTRLKGHKGKHVACSVDTHKLAVWA